jgi:parallel beta-helix repeat protein
MRHTTLQPGPLVTALWLGTVLAVFGAVLGLVAVPGAEADHVGCGDTLGSGKHVLDSDVICHTEGCATCVPVIITLTSDARLDLNGFTLQGLPGGAGTCLLLEGTGAEAVNGKVMGCDFGVLINGGGEHRLRHLTVTENNWGVQLTTSNGNLVSDSDLSGNFGFGVKLQDSHQNRFQRTVVNDTSGTALIGGYFLLASHENMISSSVISRNTCFGILLLDSSRNTIVHNTVTDSSCLFDGNPAVNIALSGDSDDNVIFKNNASGADNATDVGPDGDGINIGCKDGCGLQDLATTGANGNLVMHNRANQNTRYGIAQSSGNTGNIYFGNTATGNGVANFAIDP